MLKNEYLMAVRVCLATGVGILIKLFNWQKKTELHLNMHISSQTLVQTHIHGVYFVIR